MIKNEAGKRYAMVIKLKKRGDLFAQKVVILIPATDLNFAHAVQLFGLNPPGGQAKVIETLEVIGDMNEKAD